jgi:hypothetical protein
MLSRLRATQWEILTFFAKIQKLLIGKSDFSVIFFKCRLLVWLCGDLGKWKLSCWGCHDAFRLSHSGKF